MRDMPAPPPATCQCVGHPLAAAGCICTPGEIALRAWRAGKLAVPMTAEQRAWALDEIDGVEGYSRADYDGGTDAEIAGGVLDAWADYCRDKGLI